jgi:hypothetical protein
VISHTRYLHIPHLSSISSRSKTLSKRFTPCHHPWRVFQLSLNTSAIRLLATFFTLPYRVSSWLDLNDVAMVGSLQELQEASQRHSSWIYIEIVIVKLLHIKITIYHSKTFLCRSVSATVSDITYTLSTCTTHFEHVGHFETE